MGVARGGASAGGSGRKQPGAPGDSLASHLQSIVLLMVETLRKLLGGARQGGRRLSGLGGLRADSDAAFSGPDGDGREPAARPAGPPRGPVWLRALRGLLEAYGELRIGWTAAALAFNALMAMFPLLVGVMTVTGLLINDPRVGNRIAMTLVGMFPSPTQSQLTRLLAGANRHAGLLSLLSVGGLLWAGSGLFAALEEALAAIYGSHTRSLLCQRLVAMGMAGVFGLAILSIVAVSWLLSTVPGLAWLALPTGWLIFLWMLLIVYRVVPNAGWRWRSNLPGALLAAAGAELLGLAFPLYAYLARSVDTYGQQFGLFLLLASWTYLLCQLLLIGALVNRQLRGGGWNREAASG